MITSEKLSEWVEAVEHATLLTDHVGCSEHVTDELWGLLSALSSELRSAWVDAVRREVA